MPLFGLRKTKKNEQSQIQTSASDTKSATNKVKRAPRKAAKKAESQVESVTKENKVVAMPTGSFGSLSAAILRPRITEKSGIMSQNGVYTFEVAKTANKDSIKKAIKSLYKVTPIKVGIVNSAAKNVFIRGNKGRIPSTKKAIITLKKGDKIDFV